ncbi:predicted protein [Postia placenta Mad-698-R]|nr:predicted protein [Postia placenta Mad-698-R]
MTPPPANEFVVFCDNRGCSVWKVKGIQLKRCQGCKVKRYCSKECQTAAWPSHKGQCLEAQAARRLCNTGEQRKLWNDILRWADRNRTPCYNGLLAALDLHNRPQAQQELLLVVKLDYSPCAQHFNDRFLTTKVLVTSWQKVKETKVAWIRQHLAKIAASRACLEEEVMSLPQLVVYGVGTVVLIADFSDQTAWGGNTVILELPYRIQNLDLLARPMFSQAGWQHELMEELNKTCNIRHDIS